MEKLAYVLEFEKPLRELSKDLDALHQKSLEHNLDVSAEVNFSLRRLDAALAAGERAHALQPADLFINTTLSRIWMERGDKARAEHFGAQAKIEGWKDQLKNPDQQAGGVK